MNDILAYDLGGSSFRLAVVNDDNTISHMVRIPLSIPKNDVGGYEADPEIWWEAFQNACRQLADDGYDLSKATAIVGCGITRTQVPIDDFGNVVHPAITFADSRGARTLQLYLERAPDFVTEKVPNLSPYHPVARLLWLKDMKPDIWYNVAKIIEPKDYINLQLTGEIFSDKISQGALSGFFDGLENEPAALDIFGLNPIISPPKVSPFSQVGTVKNDLPPAVAMLEGKPVICGSTDTWTCVLGSGGLNPGAAYGISGTSDVFGIITTTPAHADGLMTVQWGPEEWQLGGPSQGAASRLQWAAERFFNGAPVEEVIHQAFETDKPAPIFLPYLDGERTPFWDSELRGAFLGINTLHESKDFLRAVADGINYLSRFILERAETAAGLTVKHVCFSGGLSNSKELGQLKADILNRPVFVPDVRESGLIGAANLARRHSGEITEITEAILSNGAWYEPDPSKRAYHDERFDIFKDATTTLTDISHQLAQSAKSH